MPAYTDDEQFLHGRSISRAICKGHCADYTFFYNLNDFFFHNVIEIISVIKPTKRWCSKACYIVT